MGLMEAASKLFITPTAATLICCKSTCRNNNYEVTIKFHQDLQYILLNGLSGVLWEDFLSLKELCPWSSFKAPKLVLVIFANLLHPKLLG